MSQKKRNIKYRLGIDIGTNSLGTALVALNDEGDPEGILHLGVRIFSDGRVAKTGESLAVTRRLARQARKRRDRYLRRRGRLMNALIEFGLMPKSEEARKALVTLDPYTLRARGLDQKLGLHELGRALFHLNQRRGFKSNRKTDSGDKEGGKIKTGIAELKKKLEASNSRTVGEYFNQRVREGESVRARLSGTGAQASYPFYLDRSLTEEEFDLLWKTQKKFHSQLTDAAREKIKDAILYQRPLKPVNPGRCTFEWEEFRCPIASPTFQRSRILQSLNQLRMMIPGEGEASLTLEQRDQLFQILLQKKEMTFFAIKKELQFNRKFGRDISFNLEDDRRQKLSGDQTAAILSKTEHFGKSWFQFSIDEQEEIVKWILNEDDTEKLIGQLLTKGVDRATAATIAETTLPSGYGSLSLKALQKIVPELERDVLVYDKAVVAAGYTSHSQLHTGEIKKKLPYYGEVLERHIGTGSGNPNDIPEVRYGKIANPTVHIALNQLRRVVNVLIRRFGPPEEVIVEVVRDLKMNKEQKENLRKIQNENTKRNEKNNKDLEAHEQEQNRENRQRLQLWEELSSDATGRRCPYTGEMISIERLFSPEVEIEHILPFSRTLDDSMANKTLSMRIANRAKKNQTPFEAFGQSPTIGGTSFEWDQIAMRGAEMPANKRWRFLPDAMERYEGEGGFVARALTDTAYLSRMSKEYLSFICPPNKVRAIPGRMTALLRGKWGLNEVLGTEVKKPDGTIDFVKNRDHHGHHAVDALVIALTDQGMLQRLSRQSALNLEGGFNRILKDFPDPWEGFYEDAKQKTKQLVVSHRKDHGTGGALHNDTAYGIVKGPDAKGRYIVRVRKSLAELDQKKIDQVEVKWLRERLTQEAAGLSEKQWEQRREELSKLWNMRRVRLIEPLSVIPIEDCNGIPYKAYKGDSNYCYDIWRSADGQKWEGRVVSTFEANQRGFNLREGVSPSGEPLVMRLRVNDTIMLEGEETPYWRIVSITEGDIKMCGISEGGDLRKRDKEKEDPFRLLRKGLNPLRSLNARLVHIDEAGFVYDPGFEG